jgi:UDP:flavonoid glycosyltransferase YjiC (YdhE family)
MSRILFTWEWGHGWGHLAKAEPILKQLANQGHDITLAVPKPEFAKRFYNDSRFIYEQVPVIQRQKSKQSIPSRGFPDLLVELGYANSTALSQTLHEWTALLDRVHPDLILADYCLTLPLATRGRDISLINLGTSFTCPPEAARKYLAIQSSDDLEDEFRSTEAMLLESMANAANVVGVNPIEQWTDFWEWDETIIASWPELEVYPRLPESRYWGPIICSSGTEPKWPEGKGPKIFVYANPFPGMGNMLDALAVLPVRVLVIARNFPDGARQRYQTQNIAIVEERLNTSAVAATCDAMIMNPGHGMVSVALLASIPCLLFPQHREQDLLASALAKQKLAAVVFPIRISDWRHALGVFLEQFTEMPELQKFARKHAYYRSEQTVNLICERISGFIIS